MKLSEKQTRILKDLAVVLYGICVGILFSLAVVAGYPLQIYPNWTIADVNISFNDTPLNVYAINGSLYLIPVSYYNYSNMTYWNYTNLTQVYNVTNITCINCTYNITNITYYNITGNNSNYESRIGTIDSRINTLEIKDNELLTKINNINLTSISEDNNKWQTKDTYMSIGIVGAVLLALFCLGVIIKNSQ